MGFGGQKPHQKLGNRVLITRVSLNILYLPRELISIVFREQSLDL